MDTLRVISVNFTYIGDVTGFIGDYFRVQINQYGALLSIYTSRLVYVKSSLSPCYFCSFIDVLGLFFGSVDNQKHLDYRRTRAITQNI